MICPFRTSVFLPDVEAPSARDKEGDRKMKRASSNVNIEEGILIRTSFQKIATPTAYTTINFIDSQKFSYKNFYKLFTKIRYLVLLYVRIQ
jgi:hypothetical protein